MKNFPKVYNIVTDFLLKEWLLIVSGIGLLITTLYVKHFPLYSLEELQILFILFLLFVTVKGLQQSKVILKIAKIIDKGKNIPLKLVLMTFFLSMLVTNDIALIIIVPLTLSLNINRKSILVVLEALAANAGSALTPFGNPQNFFIYWFYHINSIVFIEAIAPFSLVFLIILSISSFFIKSYKEHRENISENFDKKAYVYIGLFFLVLLITLHILPVFSGIFILIFTMVFDRKSLKIDYALLLTFFFFFGLAENIKILVFGSINHFHNVFIFSSLVSQVMSNVPATVLLAKLTNHWESLLWGVNAGGFGGLFGSLANLIAYKIYINNESVNDIKRFTIEFIVIGYVAFVLSIGLYFLLY